MKKTWSALLVAVSTLVATAAQAQSCPPITLNHTNISETDGKVAFVVTPTLSAGKIDLVVALGNGPAYLANPLAGITELAYGSCTGNGRTLVCPPGVVLSATAGFTDQGSANVSAFGKFGDDWQDNHSTATSLVFHTSLTSCDAVPTDFALKAKFGSATKADGSQSGECGFFASTKTASGLGTDAGCIAALPPKPSIGPVTDLKAEATSASGASVTFTVPASSGSQDLSSRVQCGGARSGDVFPLGMTTVTCSVTDDYGQTSTTSFTITVQDTTKPVLILPADQTVESTKLGAVVTFTAATATDLTAGSITPTCDHASGSFFALGPTQVTCTAADGYGNTAEGFFMVNVVDTTPPKLDATETVAGAPYDGLAWVNEDVEVAFTCQDDGSGVQSLVLSTTNWPDGHGDAPCPGPLDPATVSCPAPAEVPATPIATSTTTAQVSDTVSSEGQTKISATCVDHGIPSANQTTLSKDAFIDRTPPVVSVPATINAAPTQADGAYVDYGAVAASDALSGVDGDVTCDHPSNSLFKLGRTTVTCTATDRAGNKGQASFDVVVCFSANWSNVLAPNTAQGKQYAPPDGSSPIPAFKQGSTDPIKFFLTGASAKVQNAVFGLQTAAYANGAAGAPVDALASGNSAADTSLFRFDATSGQYVFNLSTKSLSKNTTYALLIDFGGGDACAKGASYIYVK